MTLVATRTALHSLAEHVLAPVRQQVDGRIGLHPVAGGIGTPVLATSAGTRQVLAQADAIVDRVGSAERAERITTLGAAAAFVGIELGATVAPYVLASPMDPDAPLTIDRGEADVLAAWFSFGDDALHELVTRFADRSPSEIQLWPEHFDLATTIDRVNLGVSPGDAAHDEPYLYVGPFDRRDGPFWNEPFGASMARGDVADAAAAVDFFLEGLSLTR